MSSSAQVPIVDLSASLDESAAVCRAACLEHGFFYLTNHGIPPEVIADHADAQRRFFALPLAQKMTIAADENNRGYTPVAEETLDPANSIVGDGKEGLYFGREVAAGDADATVPLHGPNQWPAEDLLGLPGYRVAVERYQRAVTALAFRLLRVLSLSLSLPTDHLDQFFGKPMVFLRPLHYPPQPSDEAGGRFAAGAHKDYGCLTVLWAPEPGLQISPSPGRWTDVTPLPDAFVVNLGDMLERWTGGKYASTTHRVVNPRGVERHSCAFFFEPSFHTLVEELPGCRAEGEEPKYPPIVSGEYLLGRYAETHAEYAAKMEAGVAKA